MSKFQFQSKRPEERHVISIHLNNELYDRFIKACEVSGVDIGRKGARTKHNISQQELIRQMIAHCCDELGV